MRIDPWGRPLASPEHPELYLTADESESGTDLIQLREMLRLSPAERLERMAAATRALGRLQESRSPSAQAAADWLHARDQRQPRSDPRPAEA